MQTLVKNQDDYIRELQEKNDELSRFLETDERDNNKLSGIG